MLRQGKRTGGRPTAAQAATIDSSILDAATRQFLASGYDATSMESVAKAAGVSKRTLYGRYPTKESLISAVVHDRVRSWAEESSKRDANFSGDFKARLIQHTQTLLHSLGLAEVRDFDRLVRSTASLMPQLARSLYEIGYQYELEFLAAAIAEGTKNDATPARDPVRVARQLFSMMIGWRRTEEMVREIGEGEAADFAREAVETLLQGRDAW